MTISTNRQNYDLPPDVTSGNSLSVEQMIDDSFTQVDGETVIEADVTIPTAPANSPLILVVDDEEAVRVMIRQILEAEGYRVIDASNGKQALTLYNQFPPELIILDWLMPVMDGFAFCQQFAQLSSIHTVPVVVLSALDDDWVVDQIFTAGATDIIAKPVHWSLLRHRVQRLLAGQQGLNQPYQTGQSSHSFRYTMAPAVEQRPLARQEYTVQLHQALEFETALTTITDQLHNSLDENQILQIVVQELTRTLNVHSCHVAIYDLNNHPPPVLKEYSAAMGRHAGRVQTDDYPQMDLPLEETHHLPCCCLKFRPERDSVIFAAPIIHEKVTIGELRIAGPAGRSLDEWDTHLVQQVARQSAIAIHQARLHQQAQARITELETLHQAKDDFLSTVSHELRSPLANIRLSIQMLEHALRQQQLNPDAQAANWQRIFTYLQILHDECEDEINLINDLLDLQRLETGHHPLHLDTINLDDWLPAIIAAFTERVKERQQNLVVDIAPDIGRIHSDHACLKRILVELLNNACKYAPPESTITVAAAMVAIQKTVPQNNSFLNEEKSTASVVGQTESDLLPPLPSPWLKITVTNTGSEIPVYEQTRIFDKFYRIPNGDPWKQGGSGLGLALVRRLVEHLGGKITVHSSTSNSSTSQTCFAIELPIDQ